MNSIFITLFQFIDMVQGSVYVLFLAKQYVPDYLSQQSAASNFYWYNF